EFAFVGHSELATQQALRYRTYPLPVLAIIPGVMDETGNVIDQNWRKSFQQRSEFIAAVSSQENRLDVSPPMSTRINSVHADICWLMQIWMQKMPWILTYSPCIQKGVDTILKAVREASESSNIMNAYIFYNSGYKVLICKAHECAISLKSVVNLGHYLPVFGSEYT